VLVDVVYKYGGDIVKFAGDAVSIVWNVGPAPDEPADMAEAVRWAVQCSFELHSLLDRSAFCFCFILFSLRGSHPAGIRPSLTRWTPLSCACTWVLAAGS
jgi:hypothetical protein